MSQDVGPNAFHILRGDVAAAIEKRVSARRERQINRRARRSAITNQALQLEPIRGRLARCPDDVDDVILYPIVDVDLVHEIARGDDLIGRDNWIDMQVRRGGRH